MIQKIKKFLIVGVASFAMLAPGLVVPALGGVASATIQQSLCYGANKASGDNGTECDKAAGGTATDPAKGIGPLAQKIVNFISILVGAIAIIMIIFGGFRYITSGGDSGRVGNAKNTIIYAIIGLIIVALAQVLVHFVINTATDTGGTFK